jgi:two-component system, NarL family, response regulator LiaR
MEKSFGLTESETVILQYLKIGLMYQEIADKLTLSINTVKKHANHIYTKLEVRNKTEAINKVYYSKKKSGAI